MVLYLFIGTVGGCIITYIGCKICDVNFNGGNNYTPSSGAILTFLGTLVGAAVGFGFGAAKLANGTHPFIVKDL